jgi:ribosome-binding factor A
MKDQRRNKLASTLRKFIANLLLYEMQDPRFSNVTITEASISNDYKQVFVYFSVLDSANMDKTEIALNKISNQIRHHIAREFTLRHIPLVYFKKDNSLLEANKIDKILEKLKKESELHE